MQRTGDGLLLVEYHREYCQLSSPMVSIASPSVRSVESDTGLLLTSWIIIVQGN